MVQEIITDQLEGQSEMSSETKQVIENKQIATRQKIQEIIKFGKDNGFEQYAIIEDHYNNLKKFFYIDKDNFDEKSFNEYINWLVEQLEGNKKINEINLDEKLSEFEYINIEEVKKATKKLYISILKILGTHRKQERLHSGSHRGIGYGKQLTLSTIEEALRSGVKKLELDILTTKDGELVISHDNKVIVDGNTKKITDLDFNEIDGNNIKEGGIEVGEIYKLERIFELLEKYPTSTKITLEIKSKQTPKKLKELLEEYSGVEDKIYISSFDGNTLKEAHEDNPNIPKVYHSFITKTNIDSVIKGLKKYRDGNMENKKGLGKSIVLGGNVIPESNNWIVTAIHSEIPEEILDMLKLSKGFLTLQTAKALGNKLIDTTIIGKLTKKVGLNLSKYGTIPEESKLEELKALLDEIGIKSIVYDPFDHELGNKNVDEMYSNTANATSYPATREPRKS